MSTVDHPPHYGGEDNQYEVIKVLRAWDLELAKGFCWGNLVKYTARAGKKDAPLEDRKKAEWYAAELVSIEAELISRKNGEASKPAQTGWGNTSVGDGGWTGLTWTTSSGDRQATMPPYVRTLRFRIDSSVLIPEGGGDESLVTGAVAYPLTCNTDWSIARVLRLFASLYGLDQCAEYALTWNAYKDIVLAPSCTVGYLERLHPNTEFWIVRKGRAGD